MKKICISIVLLISTFSTLLAQTASDALRYSTQQVIGTARFIGVGGSMSALGTDFSTLSTNPAGLAMYRKSEFMLTPGFFVAQSDSQLQGEGNASFDEDFGRFNLNNIGAVFHSRPLRALRWKSFNFGIGYNRTSDFNQELVYSGMSAGSLAQSFAESAAGVNPDNLSGFDTDLAYITGAIYDFENDLIYETDFDGQNDTPINRTQIFEHKGGTNELVFSFAGNYDHRIMIGATIGVPIVRWEQESRYNETDTAQDAIPFFRSLEYNNRIETDAIGFNTKVGIIARITQMLRLGAAVHTPTFYSMTDRFEAGMGYDFIEAETEGPFFATLEESSFNYGLRTPWRYQASGALLIQKMGFVSAEVEYVDYSSARFNYERDNRGQDVSAQETAVNSAIRAYESAINLKFGAEYVYKFLQFRAGYNINGSPFADNTYTNNVLSFGLGFRKELFYTDFAYRRATLETEFLPYTTIDAPQPLVDTETIRNDFVLTFGFRF